MISGTPRTTSAPLVLAVALAVALSGCGVRGSLENPARAETKSTAGADSGQGKAAGEAPKPHRDFVLDGLLR
jgi:predicted small lipoprotein YifL